MSIPRHYARIGRYVSAGLLSLFCLKFLLPTLEPYSKHWRAVLPEVTNSTLHGTADGDPAITPTSQWTPDVAPTERSTPMPILSKSSVAATTVDAVMPTGAILRKAVVMGKLSSEDTEWTNELQDWETAVYVVDVPANATSPTGLRTKINKANEAMPYLTYIVESYYNLPDVAVFIHSHRKGWPQAWHTDARDNDIVQLLSELKLEVVLTRGYVNLRCIEFPGCPEEIIMNGEPPTADIEFKLAYPYVYGQFFNMSADQVRQEVSVVGAPCCAQFAVSRAQILRRPKSDYERYVRLIEDSTYDSHVLGTVLEYMWHILFGQDPVDCEEFTKCSVELYGRAADYWR